ncbi:MAG: GAF domain-containing protein, partial [Dehalococcoidia bacterium]
MFLDELRQLRDRLVRASGNAGSGALPQDELASIAAGMEGLAFQIGALLPDPRRRAALYKLSFMPSGSVREVLEHAARLMAEGLGVERIKVLEMLPDGDLLVRAGVGWPPGFVGQVRDRGELGSQAGYTLMTGEGLNVEDIREETRFAFPEAEAMRDVRSSITVPIPGKHRPYGVLEADSVDPKFFKESDLRFMSIAANVIGGAISQVRAERALNVQRAIGLAVAGADGIGEAAAEVLAALGAGLEFTVAGLWCVEPDGEHMGLHHAWTAPSFTLGYPMTGHLFTRGVGRIGRVWEREEPLWSADMSAEGAAVRQAALKERGLSAGVCFPVLGRDGVLAVIELFKDEAYEPDADMLAVLGTIADQLGVFMERVEAERRWRERERDFRALVENSPDLISRFDRDLRRVYANPAAEAVLRRSDVSPLGGLAGEGLPEGARVDDWWVAAQRALATGQEQTADIYFPLDDEVHIFQTRIIPILSESGAVELVFSVGRDITGM